MPSDPLPGLIRRWWFPVVYIALWAYILAVGGLEAVPHV